MEILETQSEIDYRRIACAIEFLTLNFRQQPSLDEAAEHVGLSAFHFQRMFLDWAGVTPKQFLQFISIEHARGLLQDKQATLFDAAYYSGLSGTGRLHDLFIKVEGMTPGEYKNGGQDLVINYSFAGSPFGKVLVASTVKGICYLAFVDGSETEALDKLRLRFENATYRSVTDPNQQNALWVFNQDWSKLDEIKLHLKATHFQLRVWEALLSVPAGGLTCYSNLASALSMPFASRAVGSAVAANPVAFLIPCHRVIRASGEIGQYHWGTHRKNAMVGWEISKRLQA